MTELNAGDGSLARILTGASYGFGGPVGIGDDGTHVWSPTAAETGASG